MARPSETDLYGPVKVHLEAAGFEVKSEVGPADVVARRGDDLVIVELKVGFSLTLLQQAVARQAITDDVYVAIPRWTGRAGWRAFKGNVGLCKRLGLGVLSVRLADGFVQVHADPSPFRPRKSKTRRARLSDEFARRDGDPNTGGTRGPIVTAYKQDVDKIIGYLRDNGASKGAVVAKATGVARATRMMADNHAGCFQRLAPGLYDLTPLARSATDEPVARPRDARPRSL